MLQFALKLPATPFLGDGLWVKLG